MLMYYHFAKLYLFSHVFRGLSSSDPVPGPLQDPASGSISAAMNLINLFLADREVQEWLRGMPTHLHAMTSFACVFLLKTAAKRRDGLVDVGVVNNLTTRLVRRLRGIQVTRWHLAHLVVDGLEKSASSLLGINNSYGEGIAGGNLTTVMGRAASTSSSLYYNSGTSALHPGSAFPSSSLGASTSADGVVPSGSASNHLEPPNLNLGARSALDGGFEQPGTSYNSFGFR